MSTTPRTDVQEMDALDSNDVRAWASFARQLEQELAEARKDAARYRWLRENGGQTWQETASQPAGIRPCIFMRVPALNDSGSFILRGEQADAAIDAAMASDPPAAEKG